MLTRSRPPHGSSWLIPRGAVAVWFSVKRVSTRSACAVATRIECATGSAAARQDSTTSTAPDAVRSRGACSGRAQMYVASTLSAQTPRPAPRTNETARSRDGSVASSMSGSRSRTVPSR